MKGLQIVKQGRLPNDHVVCFLSYVEQEDLKLAECEIKNSKGLWYFQYKGFKCQAMCNCDPEGFVNPSECKSLK